MIRVCDCIMGGGKSESAITYMNEHPDDKFIYITPYLTEAARIRAGCPALHFVEPTNKSSKYQFTKKGHTAALIAEGKNITTTHQAFKGYTKDMLDDIQRHNYTLIIDENVEVLEEYPMHRDDIKIAVEAGYIEEDNNVYTMVDREYHGKVFADLFSLMKSRDLIHIPRTGKEDDLFFWALPPDLISSFKDVFILTYLFEGQSIHHFLEIYHLDYDFIGIERTQDGGYRFGDYPGYVPEYVHHLKDRLHILDNDRLNDVGSDYYALSMSWFQRGGEEVEQLKRNVSNCYNNIWRDIPADRRLWGSYKGAYNQVKGKGYARKFLTFNAKATNAYRDKDCLVYLVNIFMNVGEKDFYTRHGIEVDEDLYALSVMVQWIWRSAIRDGNDVVLYIPSERMRRLLVQWVDSLDKGESEVA